jgi:hypothetical protein
MNVTLNTVRLKGKGFEYIVNSSFFQTTPLRASIKKILNRREGYWQLTNLHRTQASAPAIETFNSL